MWKITLAVFALTFVEGSRMTHRRRGDSILAKVKGRQTECSCFANKPEYEPFCEGTPDYTTMTMVGGKSYADCKAEPVKCHWGPGEIPECATM